MEDALKIAVFQLSSQGRRYAEAVRLAACSKALRREFQPNDAARKKAAIAAMTKRFWDQAPRHLFFEMMRNELLDSDCSEEWCIEAFGSCHHSLFMAFKAIEAFGKHRDMDWCLRHFGGTLKFSSAVKLCGIEVPSLEYFQSRLSPSQLMHAVRALGISTASLGVQWFLDNFSGDDLALHIRDVNLRSYNDDPGWWLDRLGRSYLALSLLKRKNVLTPDLGVEWYAKRLQGDDLQCALKLVGLTPWEPRDHQYVLQFR